jgi:hypothetical protein
VATKKQEFDGPYDCPATGFKERCRKEKCPEWVHILGKHPQTSVDVDMFDCARRWVPVLLIEVGNQVRQAAAAMESTRNEIAKGDLARLDATTELVVQLRDAARARVLPEVPQSGFLKRLFSRGG